MNTYEELFFNSKSTLEDKIKDLIIQQIFNDGIEPTELTEINKIINYSYFIQNRCYFVPGSSSIDGFKNFKSVDNYLNKGECDYYTNGIEWNDDFEYGELTWSNHPSIEVDIKGLIQHDVSIEARVKYLTSINKEKQDYYAREIDLLNLDNLKLQEELAASIK